MDLKELHDAATYGDTKTVRKYIPSAVKAGIKDEYGIPLIHKAARHGYLDMLCYLIENKASVAATDEYGNTALHWACRYGQSICAQVLLENGACASKKNKEGKTPIIVAMESRYRADQYLTISTIKKFGAQIRRTKSKKSNRGAVNEQF